MLLVDREVFRGMPLDRRVGRRGTTALLSVDVGTTLLLPPPPVMPVVAVAEAEAVVEVVLSGEADTVRSVRWRVGEGTEVSFAPSAVLDVAPPMESYIWVGGCFRGGTKLGGEESPMV